jgi:putative ABC transport system permease protein
VGVAGCTALVVSALVLQNNVLASFHQQFETEFAFDMVVTPRDENIEGAAQALTDIGSASTPVLRRSSTISSGPGEVAFGYLVVPTTQQSFFDLYRMHSTDGSPIDLSQTGVYVSAGYADKTHAKIGDVVSVRGPSGIVRKTNIVGFYTYYLVGVEMVMGPITYQRLYGELPRPNVLLAASDGDELAADFLAKVDHTGTVLTVVNHKSRSSRVFQAFQKISDTVVKLYVGLATLMAIVVLLNLNTMFVEEKRRELTVLMILGFSVRDAKAYVRNDTIVLTVIGIIIGVAVGTGFGILAVISVEPMNTVFIREPNLAAALMGAGVSAVLSAVMGYLAFRRIPKFKLTDINRM